MQNVIPEFLSVQQKDRKQEDRDSSFVSSDWAKHQAMSGSGKIFAGQVEILTSDLEDNYLYRFVDVQRQLQYTRTWPVKTHYLRNTIPKAELVQLSESIGEVIQSEISMELFIPRKKVDWLEEALNELKACPELAVDEGMDKPSRLALKKTKVLLKTISKYVEDQPDIYPMDECSIAIDFRNPDLMSGILFLIENDGSGAYFSRTRKSKARTRVADAADLLDEGGLKEFERLGIR